MTTGEQPGGTLATETVAGHPESVLLAAFLPSMPSGPSALLGPGDDAAVVAAPDGRVVVTTDVLVEGRDFRRDWSSGADVGWKAAMQNLADVAAMGAVPTGLVVGLAMPDDLPRAWVMDFASGLGQACRAAGTGVVGGDLSGAPVVVVSVTALGDLHGRPAVLRSGARPGDVLAVAGRLGWAAAGLDLLRHGHERQETTGGVDVSPFVDAQRRPRPPLDAGPEAARHGVRAMLDVSDGLGVDARRLALASGVDVTIDADWVERAAAPLLDAARALDGALDGQLDGQLDGHREGDPATRARSWVLGGGEDHALLAAFAPDVPLPAPFARVGSVGAPVGAPRVRCGGVDVRDGWDHFA